MTDIQICNLALARLGDSRITALADATAQAQYCTLFYAQTLEELQAEFDWQFCRKQVSLTSGTAPLTGYSIQYALPADFIRAIRLGNIDASENFGSWEIIGTNLHTNIASPVALDYIALITTTTLFPAIFTEALSMKLAAVLAMPLTGSKDLFTQCVQLYSATIQKPAFGNATEAYAPARTTAAIVSVSEICRQAILRVGTADVFKPYGEPMSIATSLFDQTRNELLADFDWQFARVQNTIAADLAPPAFGYAKRYSLPLTTLKVLRVNGVDEDENFGKWEIVGGYLHTDVSPTIQIETTAIVTDASKFPPVFVNMLTVTLAIKLSQLMESQPAQVVRQ